MQQELEKDNDPFLKQKEDQSMTQNSPQDCAQQAQDVVLTFLKAMEGRDLETAQSMLGADFQMEFPGSGIMHSLPQLVDWAKERYQFVEKTMEDVSCTVKSESVVCVYCHGTLAGRWIDGSAFEGIRFIDRFEICNNLIVRQDVWNDLALYAPF